ncbi:MAG: hypothetical protein ABR613_12990 [Actinomycetota bacterium]
MTLHRVELAMLDVPFAVETDDERIARFVRTFWEPFLASHVPDDAVPVVIRGTGDRWELRSEGDPGAEVQDPWVLGTVLRNLLTMKAVRLAADVVPVHASVAERDGVHLVLAGPSEAGKTTLMLELLARGWGYVSDDMAPIDGATGLAGPLRKPLQVRDPARWASTTGRWRVPDWLPEPRRASLVPPGALPSSSDRPYRPTVLVFSTFGAGEDPRSEPLSPGEAVALAGQNLQFRAVSARDVGALAAWAGAAPAVRIRYGSSEEALRLLDEALGRATPLP